MGNLQTGAGRRCQLRPGGGGARKAEAILGTVEGPSVRGLGGGCYNAAVLAAESPAMCAACLSCRSCQVGAARPGRRRTAQGAAGQQYNVRGRLQALPDSARKVNEALERGERAATIQRRINVRGLVHPQGV